MKKVLAFLLAFLCVFSVKCKITSAEEIVVNDNSLESVVYSAGLINGYYLAISSSGTSIQLTAKTKGNYSMKSIGLKNITVQYSSNGTDWSNYMAVGNFLEDSTIVYYTENNSIASVSRGYYYRVTCNHYAKEQGLFGSSESIYNISNSIYIP